MVSGFGQMMALYSRLAKASIRARMQYRANFILTVLMDGALFAMDFLLMAAILYRFDSIGGWSVFEIGLLYGAASMARGVYRTFGYELHRFESYIAEGHFDTLMVRPWPTLLVLLTRNLDIGRLGAAAQGALVLGISCHALIKAGSLSAGAMAYVWILPLWGAAIFFAISLATSASAFWLTRIADLQVFTMYAPMNAASYPLGIYPASLRALLHTALPVAFAGYVPIRFLLGKGGSAFDLVTPVLVAMAALYVSYWFWRLGESGYQSTGS